MKRVLVFRHFRSNLADHRSAAGRRALAGDGAADLAGFRATLASARAAGDKHFRPQIAWPTLATGVGPDRHGVTRFFHTADDLCAATLWDRFQQAGGRVGLFGWPITWPVRPVNGF
jgi:hypothetical protein